MSERKVVFVDGREIYSINIGQGFIKTRLLATNEKITGAMERNLNIVIKIYKIINNILSFRAIYTCSFRLVFIR